MREGTEPPEAAPPPEESASSDTPPSAEAPSLEPAEPSGPPAATSTDAGSLARSAALGVVAFVATLVLLVGFSTLLSRSGERGAVGASASPSLVAGSGSGGSPAIPSAGPSLAAVPTNPPG